MRITAGYTRVVILVGDKAIKIARVGGVTAILRQLFMSTFKRGWFKQKISERGGKTFKVLLKHVFELLFNGILANQREYHAFRDHPELPIAPVHNMYLGGLVLVMERGEPASLESSEYYRSWLAGYGDLSEPRHYCMIRGKVRIIDYAHPDLYAAFGISDTVPPCPT